jgi:hypothetical protein
MFRAAAVVSGTTGLVEVQSRNATREAGEPAHAGTSGGASVWWRWVAPVSGRMLFLTEGSDFDTVLAVYTGDSLSSLRSVASNDDVSGALWSRVSFEARAGTTYWIAVDGFRGTTGRVRLSWRTEAGSAAVRPAGDMRSFTSPTGRPAPNRGERIRASGPYVVNFVANELELRTIRCPVAPVSVIVCGISNDGERFISSLVTTLFDLYLQPSTQEVGWQRDRNSGAYIASFRRAEGVYIISVAGNAVSIGFLP